MTVREAIKEMRKYGGRTIYTNNGTKIAPLEIGCDPYEAIGKVKVINGEKIYRSIFCAIEPSAYTKHMDIIEKHSLYYAGERGYQYFRKGDYDIPERDMNLFINLNGGIDEYLTISVPYYMASDTKFLFSDMW